jgi:hypothetical protein
VSTQTQTSVIFDWSNNLGPSGAQIIVAPAATGTASPAACQLGNTGGSLTLAPEVTSYTYPFLNPNTKYGFRFCSTDRKTIPGGATIWFDTNPPEIGE